MSVPRQPFWSNRPVKSDAPTDPAAPATAADGPLPVGRQVRVLVLEGPSAGTTVAVSGGGCTIGSDASCDVVLADPKVSRRHARCELFSRAVRVVALEGASGFGYLGHQVTEVVVPYGATLRVGGTRLCFERTERAGRSSEPELGGLRGESEAMRRVFFALQRLATLDTPVLFLGAQGTGKTAAARTVHSLSPRGANPFVVFAAETATAESLSAALRQAASGTLLITHVSELNVPLTLDGHACRLLFTSVDDAPRFESLAANGVELPTLDSRPEDIPVLAQRFAAAMGGTLSREVLDDLSRRRYPGNVAELEREVALMLKRGTAPAAAGYNALRDQAVQAFEAQYLASLLERHQGNVSAAAREAGLSRSQFYRVLRRHPSLMSAVRSE